jgi:hypothetical protein
MAVRLEEALWPTLPRSTAFGQESIWLGQIDRDG